MTPSLSTSDPANWQELPRPVVAVDLVMLTIISGDLHVYLTKRGVPPFNGDWSLPGTVVQLDQSLEHAAAAELERQAGTIPDSYLEQLYTFGQPERDPRGRVITVVYYALINETRLPLARMQRSDAHWFPMHQLPPLAFDHEQILTYTLTRLRGKLEYTMIGFQLLGPTFTLSELQVVYEAILGRGLDKRNFRKKILATDILEETADFKMEGPHRPARLYRFRPNAARD